MSYYELGQTSEYTGNSPWCYSYDKSLNDPTDQFGPLLNTNVKTASVNPCHCRSPLGPGADCAVGGSNECGPGLHCRKEGASGQLGGIGVCSYTGKAEGMPCFGGARDPCGPNYRCHSDGIGGSGYCVPRHHPGPRPTRRPTPQKTLFPIPTSGPTRRPTPQKTLFPIPTRGPTRRPTPQKTLFPIPTSGPTRRPHPSPHPAPSPVPTNQYTYYIRIPQSFIAEYGDAIIPLTKSEFHQHSRNLCQTLASIPLNSRSKADLTNVFYFIANNQNDGEKLSNAERQFINALLQLSNIKALKKYLKSPNMKNTPATFKAKMIKDALSINTWSLKDLRGMRRVDCSRIPGPRPGPDLSVTYCTDVSDDWCTDHFNPQGETCLMNCITLQKKDWPSGADSHVAACNSRFKFDPAGTRGNAGYAGGCTSNESEISHYFNKELGEYQECRMCSNDQFLCGGCPPSDHSGVY